jgi:hypothetical protein
MPRPFGILLIAAASLLCGVFAWFGLIWLFSVGATLAGAPVLEIAMFVLSPHMTGWLVALGLGVVAFVLIICFARSRGLSWLGFAGDPASKAHHNR